MRRFTTLMLVASLGLAGAVNASEKEMRPYFTEMLTYTFADSDRRSDDAWGGMFGIGIPLNQYWGLETGLFYEAFAAEYGGKSTNVGNNNNRWVDYGGYADALYFYSRNPRFSPYFAVGAGLTRSHMDVAGPDPQATQPFYGAGLGFISHMKYFAVRGDIRYRYTDVSDTFAGRDDFEEARLGLGVVLPFGAKASSTPVAAPVAAPVVADSDGDGVNDTIDRCPGTPRGVRVDAAGCPLDSDGDGVPDYLDRCPNTPVGTAVDRNGCPLATAIDRKFEDVNFGFDRFDLTDYARVTLDKTAATINDLARQNPSLRVDVTGHTDSIGTEQYNNALGQKRADVVRSYLVRKGVDASRLASGSQGESSPVASNSTAKGRLLNRRTEIRARTE